ncbi:MAG: hypothetical protein QME14_09655 [Methanobacteriaceae archaeon]|nr:hypothetical protein [Methanobacteriaceae archaeon]
MKAANLANSYKLYIMIQWCSTLRKYSVFLTSLVYLKQEREIL